jgi:hypothetical protein
MGRTCRTYGEKRTAYRIFVGKLEGEGLLGRPRRMWENKRIILKWISDRME